MKNLGITKIIWVLSTQDTNSDLTVKEGCLTSAVLSVESYIILC